MKFLLDTDICSAHLRQRRGLFHRFIQHGGGLATSTVSLAELFAWAYKQDDPSTILRLIDDLVEDVIVVPFDADCSKTFGQLRGAQLRDGRLVGALDLMIAAVAITHDLTLVTHNAKDFRTIPGLRVEDWLES